MLYDNIHRESYTTCGPHTSVPWMQLLRKQTNTGTTTALIAETHWCTPYGFAHSRDLWLLPGSLTLLTSEAGDCVELILLYLCYNCHLSRNTTLTHHWFAYRAAYNITWFQRFSLCLSSYDLHLPGKWRNCTLNYDADTSIHILRNWIIIFDTILCEALIA